MARLEERETAKEMTGFLTRFCFQSVVTKKTELFRRLDSMPAPVKTEPLRKFGWWPVLEQVSGPLKWLGRRLTTKKVEGLWRTDRRPTVTSQSKRPAAKI